MPIKRIRLTCHEPLAVNPAARQPWADVYLTFKAIGGRRTVHLGPTLMSRDDLLRSAEISAELAAENPALFQADAIKETALLARLDQEGIIVDRESEGCADGVPDVYTRSPWIDRAEAERMVRALLAVHGITRCRLDWARPRIVITPT